MVLMSLVHVRWKTHAYDEVSDFGCAATFRFAVQALSSNQVNVPMKE